MRSLNRGFMPPAPPRPAGVEMQRIRFEPAIEPPREILAALYVGISLFVPTGLAAIVAARAVWSLTASTARGALRLYAITLTAVGAIGLFIASAPHLIWGLTLAAGLLNLLALRRPRAVTPPYSA